MHFSITFAITYLASNVIALGGGKRHRQNFALDSDFRDLAREICLNQRGIVLSNSDDILFGDKCSGRTRRGDVWRSSTNEIDFYSNSIAAAERLGTFPKFILNMNNRATEEPYTITQKVRGLTPGTRYYLAIRIANNCRGGFSEAKFGFIEVTGGNIFQRNDLVTGAYPKKRELWFTATSDTHEISVGSTSSGSCGMDLDYFRVHK
jgi:hypothetical protein